ncbi:Cytochrome P450 [Penicillium roqueforti FM164]|uniref:Cytochrome P450 n=1 Tax=Penicillium roqueforti (strain FM164) TaxID=1365484 RepID=W6Q1T2_PENRF|nr:Cytochrome P450 [Penicillium roqueforti FM164]
MRDVPGQQTVAQIVAPSPIHLGWGFGQHACPGRSFAANETCSYMTGRLWAVGE